MASIKEFPGVVKKLGWGNFLKRVWQEVGKDDVFTWGSALAYAWIFAIFPFLIFLLTLAPYLPGNAKEQILTQISEAAYNGLGSQGGDQVAKSIYDVMSNQHGGLLSVGLILALWGASGGMVMTMSALDRAYYVRCTRSFMKQRLVAIGLTIASAVLVLAVVVLLPVGTKIIQHIFYQGILGAVGFWLVNILRYVVALALLLLIVALIYYFGPCIKQKWHSITPGAIFTVVMWIMLGFGFGFYVSHFGSFNKTYGALGAAIVLLLFFYINAVVLLIGAEINSVLDFETLGVKHGSADFTHTVGAGDAIAQTQQPRSSQVSSRRGPRQSSKGRKALIWVPALLAVRWAWKHLGSGGARRRRPITA